MMPHYQIEVSILLAISAACSLLTFTVSPSKEGQISLHDDGYEHGTQPDPFDITKPEDVIDGYPLDEQVFWITVR